jgi:DNA-binding transcriptional ArsR family regulator
MNELIKVTKALSDESRVRALMAVRDRELCLCQLIDLLGLAPSTVSKHMAVLAEAGLVARRKEGRWHFYRGTASSPTANAALAWLTESLRTSDVIRDDARTLEDVMSRDLEELSACYRD